jgi:hypothetical protein
MGMQRKTLSTIFYRSDMQILAEATLLGFEPTRENPIGLAGQPLTARPKCHLLWDWGTWDQHICDFAGWLLST